MAVCVYDVHVPLRDSKKSVGWQVMSSKYPVVATSIHQQPASRSKSPAPNETNLTHRAWLLEGHAGNAEKTLLREMADHCG